MDAETQQKSVFKDEATQKNLNTPLADPKGAGDEQAKFFKLLIQLIEDGKIDLMNPESLINKEFYDTLPEETQAKADFEAVNLLSIIRDIKGLYDLGHRDTYQILNLVESVFNAKKRLEEAKGDIFII